MNTLTRGIGCISNQVEGAAGDCAASGCGSRVAGGRVESDMLHRHLCAAVPSVVPSRHSRSHSFVTTPLQRAEGNMSN